MYRATSNFCLSLRQKKMCGAEEIGNQIIIWLFLLLIYYRADFRSQHSLDPPEAAARRNANEAKLSMLEWAVSENQSRVFSECRSFVD
jgi:hypothetical protein